MYTGEADHRLTAELVELVDVPVVASGDVVAHERAMEILESTCAEAVMVGRAAQGNPWTLREIVDGVEERPSREEVAAELIVFIRQTARELGERRSAGFLKKFYGWYLRRGGFPRPFVQELVRLETTDEVVKRLLIAEPDAAAAVARIEADMPDSDGTLVPLPISAFGGG
jgi:tRNA-dihydrouridine synthase B